MLMVLLAKNARYCASASWTIYRPVGMRNQSEGTKCSHWHRSTQRRTTIWEHWAGLRPLQWSSWSSLAWVVPILNHASQVVNHKTNRAATKQDESMTREKTRISSHLPNLLKFGDLDNECEPEGKFTNIQSYCRRLCISKFASWRSQLIVDLWYMTSHLPRIICIPVCRVQTI